MDPSGRSFPLIARLTDREGMAAPGMSLSAHLPTSALRKHLTVEKNAVLRGDTGAFLYVARGGGGEEPTRAFVATVRVLFGAGEFCHYRIPSEIGVVDEEAPVAFVIAVEGEAEKPLLAGGASNPC